MINLLPEENKKEIVGVYLSRQVAIFCLLLLVLFISSVILLSAIYIYHDILDTSPRDKVLTEESNQLSEYQSLKNELTLINKQIASVQGNGSESPLFILGQIITAKPAEVKIEQLALEKNPDKTYKAAIMGKAKTRQALLDYISFLEKNPLFSKVDSPLSNLLNEKDVQFSISLILKKNLK